ncbi:MAG: CBS domain-containing protein [Bacteriovoracia bacterium]
MQVSNQCWKAFFEIIGPIVLRKILIKTDEVNKQALLTCVATRATLSLQEMLRNFVTNLNILPLPHYCHEHAISDLVDRKVLAISNQASFQEVIKFIENHQQPLYPVVDQDYRYLGLISISEIQDIMIDPVLSRLMFAQRLIGKRSHLSEDTHIDEAVQYFNQDGQEILPVVHPETGKLIGMLSYKKLLSALKKRTPEDHIASA